MNIFHTYKSARGKGQSPILLVRRRIFTLDSPEYEGKGEMDPGIHEWGKMRTAEKLLQTYHNCGQQGRRNFWEYEARREIRSGSDLPTRTYCPEWGLGICPVLSDCILLLEESGDILPCARADQLPVLSVWH